MANPLKNIQNQPILLLQYGLGIVFFLAGLQRIFFFEMARQNFIDLGLVPAVPLVILTIFAELVASLCFFTDRHVEKGSALIVIVLLIGITASIIRAGSSLVQNFNEVFLLTYTPTNIVMHTTYLIGILAVLLNSLKKK